MAGGRPTKYKLEYAGVAKKMCELGATDDDICQALNIAKSTYYKWKLEHQEFSDAIVVGQSPANNRVKMALYRRAVGYERQSEKIFQFQGEEVRIPFTEVIEPDVRAAEIWLRNKMPEEFRANPEVENKTVIQNIMPVPTADSADDWEQAASSNQDYLLSQSDDK